MARLGGEAELGGGGRDVPQFSSFRRIGGISRKERAENDQPGAHSFAGPWGLLQKIGRFQE